MTKSTDSSRPIVSDSADTPRPARESLFGAFGLLAGLMLLVMVFVGLWLSRRSEIDGAAQLSANFAIESVPAGWKVLQAEEIPAGFFTFGPGERIVHVASEVNLTGDQPPAPPGFAKEWKELAEGKPLGEASRLIFAWYGPQSGAEQVQAQLSSRRAVELSMLDEKGGVVRMDAGMLPWSGFDAEFVHERFFDKGAFRDAVRVNLSTGGRHAVVNILFAWNQRGSKAAAERLLGFFPAR